MNPTPERMSKSDFAATMGWSTAYVSQLAKAHRLVLDDDGLVIVDRSRALIRATRKSATQGGDRTGKHARLAAERAAAQDGASAPATEGGASFPAGAAPAAPASAEPMSLADAARAEKIERTRKLLLENATAAGLLVRRDAVEAEVFRRTRQAQEAMLALKDRLVPLLAIEVDEQAIDALLDRELRHVLASLSGATSTEAGAETARAAA